MKDKRQVIRSLAQRIRNKYHAAVAEVGDNDAWQVASLGIACVSNSARHCEQMIADIVSYIEASRLDAEIVEETREIIDFEPSA